jgi:hypothetical protein
MSSSRGRHRDLERRPAARNVSFWADWVEVRHEYHAGKRVGNFRFALEAQAPRSRDCDRWQD